MSQGMAARLAWAVVSALALGFWLRQSVRRGGERSSRLAAWLRVSVLIVCAFWALTWLVLALLRLRYPFELEWIGGAMRDHCERILNGQPFYVPPGPGWFPYEYPPLYFWISAFIMRLTGGESYATMRIVSIGSTLGCTALIWLWTRRLIGERRIGNLWGAISAGLFLASYRLTGAWYDVERLDMLFLFLSLLGIFWLGEGMAWTVCAALAFALAFFTKQQAVLFILGGVVALAWRRDYRQMLFFAGVSLGACLLPALALNAATQGWFGYYCFKVPLANGVQLHLARQYFLNDLPLFAPTIVILVLGAWIKAEGEKGRRGEREKKPSSNEQSLLCTGQDADGESDKDVSSQVSSLKSQVSSSPLLPFSPSLYREGAILIAMTGMGIAGSLLSRAHWGGDQNVLMTGFVFVGITACVMAGQWERRQPWVRAPLYTLLLAQMLTLTYRPSAQLPTAANLQAGRSYMQMVHRLEQEGEVLCLDHGNITQPRHFQIMGLLDVMNTEKRVLPALTAALRAHRYAVILTDALPGQGSPFGAELYRDYTPVECLHFDRTWTVTGYPTPDVRHPVWVLRPVKQQGR